MQSQGGDQPGLDQQLRRHDLVAAVTDLNGTAFRIATDRTAGAAAYGGIDPFLHWLARNPDPVGLRWVGLKGGGIDFAGLQHRLDSQRQQLLAQLLAGPLDLVARTGTARAGLPALDESLPDDRSVFMVLPPSGWIGGGWSCSLD